MALIAALALYLSSYATRIQSAPVSNTANTQYITFDFIPSQTYGDAPLQLETRSSSGLPVTFRVVKGAAEISGSTLTFTGAGNVTVRASQTGNSTYKAAQHVERTFKVEKAPLLAKAVSRSINKRASIPVFEINYSGFLNGEDASDLDQKPKAGTAIKKSSNAGTYPIRLSSGKDNNYALTLENGTLTVLATGGGGGSGSLVVTGGGTLTLHTGTTYPGPGNTTLNPGTLTVAGSGLPLLGSNQPIPTVILPMLAEKEPLPPGSP